MTNQYFPSARSKLLGFILWGILLTPFCFSLYEAFQESLSRELFIRIMILSSVLVFIAIIWFGTGYVVSDRELIIRIGPIVHSRIDLRKISEISGTNSPISAPANSFKRLAIKSDKMLLVMVSPRDQAGFIEALKEGNPDINADF